MTRPQHSFGPIGRYLQTGIRIAFLAIVLILASTRISAATQLFVQVPATTVEGRGTLTNAGKLGLIGVAPSNVVVTIISSDPASILVPTNATILSGQSKALFSLLAQDDLTLNG